MINDQPISYWIFIPIAYVLIAICLMMAKGDEGEDFDRCVSYGLFWFLFFIKWLVWIVFLAIKILFGKE